MHDPRAYESGNPAIAQWRHRGVAYWENAGDARIVWATGDGFLIAVDAKTGIPAPDFGDDGRVDLMDGVPRATRGERDILNLLPLSSQSPPLVIRDTIIVGSTINDRTITREATPGFARAYDVRTGRHRWDFHTVPQSADEFGSDTWLDESWRYSGNTNIWSMMSGDEELGWVYLPIGTPTNDYYGGHRLGDNLFAESIVAVDVETGQRQWHFQTIHHGLWDYDLPAAPNLLDITVDGREIKAVAQVSKQGFVYVFDRITGEPVWPIEELPVPTDTDLEGEILSPTQPFPTRPAAFEYQGTSIDDLVDFTPEIRQMAVDAVQGFRLGPLYTPQMLRGTIMRPPVGGGASWSGAAVDPETGYLYVPSFNGHSTIRLTEPEPHEPSTLRYIRRSISAGPVMPRGLPLWKPPYTRMTAIDMNTGEHAWMIPTGNGDRIRNHPMLRDLDLPPLGGDAGRSGPLLTKTLLIHALTAGGSDGGPRLVAYDKANGTEIASLDLPGRGARGADDLPAGRGAAHRADGGRRGAGADRVPAAASSRDGIGLSGDRPRRLRSGSEVDWLQCPFFRSSSASASSGARTHASSRGAAPMSTTSRSPACSTSRSSGATSRTAASVPSTPAWPRRWTGWRCTPARKSPGFSPRCPSARRSRRRNIERWRSIPSASSATRSRWWSRATATWHATRPTPSWSTTTPCRQWSIRKRR